MYGISNRLSCFVCSPQLKFYQEMLGDWRFQRALQPDDGAAQKMAARDEEEAIDEKNIVSTKRRRGDVDYAKLQLEVQLFSISSNYHMI